MFNDIVGAVAGGGLDMESIGSIAGGAIGGMFGPIGAQVGSMIGGMIGEAVGGAIQEFGERENLPQAEVQKAVDELMKAVNQYVDANQLKGQLDNLRQQLSPFDNAAVQKEMDNLVSSLADLMQEMMNDQTKENVEDAKKGGKGEGSKGGGESWLVALAQAMGNMLGDRIEKMMDAKETMEGADKESKEFITASQEFNAQAKMFGMLSDVANNVIKTIGESLSSTARKQ